MSVARITKTLGRMVTKLERHAAKQDAKDEALGDQIMTLSVTRAEVQVEADSARRIARKVTDLIG